MSNQIRPTQDKIRKAVFDILGHDLSGLTFLDLFAGSGSVGLEAFSQGAQYVSWVEKDFQSAEIINNNLRALNISSYDNFNPQCFVITGDVFSVIPQLHRQNKTFDIVFVDPPYGVDLAKKTLKTLGEHDILTRNSFIIIQHEKRETLPEAEGRFLVVRKKKYGSTLLTVYESK